MTGFTPCLGAKAAMELSYVLITPYSIRKSRTGGIVSRVLSRSGLELAAARMFAPSRELVEEFAAASIMKCDERHRHTQELLRDYILKKFSPDAENVRQRVLLLDAAVPAVDRVAGRHGLCQGGRLLEDEVDIVRQLRVVALDDHHIVPTARHDALGDGALGEQGIDGDDPSGHNQPTQDFLQDRDLLGLVRHGLLPQGQPQPVTEHREQMGRRGPLLVTAPQGFPLDGEGFWLVWSRRQSGEDAFRPRAQGGFY